MHKILDQQRPWNSPEIDSLHQKVSKEGGWCEGSSSKSARWWSTSRRLGPAIMPASAPRPLALAGVTRNKQIRFYSVYHDIDTYGHVDRKTLQIDNNVVTAILDIASIVLFLKPIWIHHLTGASMHLVFQSFPGYQFHWLP